MPDQPRAAQFRPLVHALTDLVSGQQTASTGDAETKNREEEEPEAPAASAISLFEEKQVRRAWSATEEKWLFAIVDVIAILMDSVDAGSYRRKLKERLKNEGIQPVTICHGLEMTAAADRPPKYRMPQNLTPARKTCNFRL